MGFLSDLVKDFSGSDKQGQQQSGYGQQQSGYGQQPYQQQSNSSYGSQPPPVSPPWYAEWDSRENRWLFVNQQTGERTFNQPGAGYSQQQGNYGAPPQQGGYGYGQGGYSNQGAYQQTGYDPSRGSGYQHEEHKSGGNGMKYAAAGAAGLAGGALLMHESDNIGKPALLKSTYNVPILPHTNPATTEHGFDNATAGAERRFDEFGNDISNFPENAAGYAGEQVGRVENFGDDVEQKWDNGVNDVENFPENAAEWTGEKVQAVEDIPQDMENKWDSEVQGVEQFGDRMDNAYDQGRDEERYEDDY
jgi:hypothetical protein